MHNVGSYLTDFIMASVAGTCALILFFSKRLWRNRPKICQNEPYLIRNWAFILFFLSTMLCCLFGAVAHIQHGWGMSPTPPSVAISLIFMGAESWLLPATVAFHGRFKLVWTVVLVIILTLANAIFQIFERDEGLVAQMVAGGVATVGNVATLSLSGYVIWKGWHKERDILPFGILIVAGISCTIGASLLLIFTTCCIPNPCIAELFGEPICIDDPRDCPFPDYFDHIAIMHLAYTLGVVLYCASGILVNNGDSPDDDLDLDDEHQEFDQSPSASTSFESECNSSE